jgi:UDP-glucose 4-epimerase
VRDGYAVTVFDNLRTGQRDKVHAGAVFIEGSILDTNALDTVFSSQKFDAVIHLAALKAVGESEAHPAEYFATNVTGTINVLAMMEKHAIPHIVFSSTAAVYAPHAGDVFNEESPLGSMSVYGTTKIIAEAVIREFTRTKKIRSHALLRYFNVAGDCGLQYTESNAQNVFPILAHALTTDCSFSVFGTDYETRDGTCVRDYIHLLDLVDAHVRALSVVESITCNLGTENGVTVAELVRAFEEQSGKAVRTVHTSRRAGDPATVIAQSRRAREILGWEPQQTLADMVRSTLEVYA